MFITNSNSMSSSNIGMLQGRRNSFLGLPSGHRQTVNVPQGSEDSQVGAGVFRNIVNMAINKLPSSDENARPAFAGENHAILTLSNGRTGMANYMGPGTHVLERLKRGDPPRSQSDKVAKRHDIDYQLAASQPTRELQLQKIREADQRMVSKLKEVKDSTFNRQLGMKAIQAKMGAEDLGLISKSRYAGSLKTLSKDDTDLLMSEKAKLEQEGFGVGYKLKQKLMKKEKRKKGQLPTGMSINKDLPDSEPYQSVNFNPMDGGSMGVLTGRGLSDIVSNLVNTAFKKLKIPENVLPKSVIDKVVKDLGNKIDPTHSVGKKVSTITKGITPLLGMGYMKGRGLNLAGYGSMMKNKKRKNKLYGVVSNLVLNKLTGKQIGGSKFWDDLTRTFRMLMDPIAGVAALIPSPIQPLAATYTGLTQGYDVMKKAKK